MKSWHRDAMLIAGVLSVLVSAFMVGAVLGFLALGVTLVQAALQLAPDEGENDGQ